VRSGRGEVRTFAVITTNASELVADIHVRMPLILAPGPDCANRQTGIDRNGSSPERPRNGNHRKWFPRDIKETVRTDSELRSMGVAISLDNFGTGYSSLTYLRRLPIDQLKIDESFVRDLSSGQEASVLLSQIIQLGHTMHLEVVAEGVESETEFAFLADNHCDLVQG
jgi:EAL domain